MTIIERIIDMIDERGPITFIELQKHLAPFFPTFGDRELHQAGNVVLWLGLSPELAEAVQALVADGRITMRRTTVLVYLFEGAALPVRIALGDQPPKDGYKHPRWMPVVFNLPPGDGPAQRAPGHKKDDAGVCGTANRSTWQCNERDG
jgi:hypothetical protein